MTQFYENALAPDYVFGIQPSMSEQKPTTSNPTPEQRVGDSSIKPVVIAFLVTILIILVAAIIFIKARQNKVVPKANPRSQLTQPLLRTTPLRLTIAA